MNLPITDIRVKTAVSVADAASRKTDSEHESMEVMANPMGLYLGLIACKASFNRPTLEKIVSGEFEGEDEEVDKMLFEAIKGTLNYF